MSKFTQTSLDLEVTGNVPRKKVSDLPNSKRVYEIQENWNFKIGNQVFCEVIPEKDSDGWQEVGREYTFMHKGQKVCDARVIGCQPCKKSDVISNNMPSMLMNLAFGSNAATYHEHLEKLPKSFYFMLFEKKTQLSLFD